MPKLAGTHWRKSSRSNAGNCVEVADGLDGLVGLRDSKDPSGPVLAFPSSGWAAFVRGLKDGRFRP